MFDRSQYPIYFEWDGEIHVMRLHRCPCLRQLATFLLDKVPELKTGVGDLTVPWSIEKLLSQLTLHVNQCFVTNDPTITFEDIRIKAGDLIVIRPATGSQLERQIHIQPEPVNKCALTYPALYKLLREEVACHAMLHRDSQGADDANQASPQSGEPVSSFGNSSYGIRLSKVPHLGAEELNTHWADFPSDASLHLAAPLPHLPSEATAALSAAAEAKYSYDTLGLGGEGLSTFEEFLEQDSLREAEMKEKVRVAALTVARAAPSEAVPTNRKEDLDRLFASFRDQASVSSVAQHDSEGSSVLEDHGSPSVSPQFIPSLSNYEADYAGILNFLGTDEPHVPHKTNKGQGTRSLRRRERFYAHLDKMAKRTHDNTSSLRDGRKRKLDSEPLSSAQEFRDTQSGRIFNYDLFTCWISQEGRPTSAQLASLDPNGLWMRRSSIFFEVKSQVSNSILCELLECIPSVAVLKLRRRLHHETQKVFAQLFNPRQAFLVTKVLNAFFGIRAEPSLSYPKQRTGDDAIFTDHSCTVLKKRFLEHRPPAESARSDFSKSILRTLRSADFTERVKMFLEEEVGVKNLTPVPYLPTANISSYVNPNFSRSLTLRLHEMKKMTALDVASPVLSPPNQCKNEAGYHDPPTEKKILGDASPHRDEEVSDSDELLAAIKASSAFYCKLSKRKTVHFDTAVNKLLTAVNRLGATAAVTAVLHSHLVAVCALAPRDLLKTNPKQVIVQTSAAFENLKRTVTFYLTTGNFESLAVSLNNCYHTAAIISEILESNAVTEEMFVNSRLLDSLQRVTGKGLIGACSIFLDPDNLKLFLQTARGFLTWLSFATHSALQLQPRLSTVKSVGKVFWSQMDNGDNEERLVELSFAKGDAPSWGDASTHTSPLSHRVIYRVTFADKPSACRAVLKNAAPSFFELLE